jgi:hypothetical protein
MNETQPSEQTPTKRAAKKVAKKAVKPVLTVHERILKIEEELSTSAPYSDEINIARGCLRKAAVWIERSNTQS